MRTAELDNILNVTSSDGEEDVAETKGKAKAESSGKAKSKKPAKVKPQKVTKTKILTTSPITFKQTRSKWLNEIKEIVKALPQDKCINIIDVYGGNGLLCYWFKELAGNRVKIYLNDWDNLCCKYSLTDKYEHYLDNINIIKVNYNNPLNFIAQLIDMDIDTAADNSILILDARCFDINLLYYIYNNFSIILFDNADDYSKTNIINCYNNALQIFGNADTKTVNMDTETVWKSASEYMFKRLFLSVETKAEGPGKTKNKNNKNKTDKP